MGRPREFEIDESTGRALQVFWVKGYEGTSVPDLVEATGIQRGSLYAAYGSKHALYLAALDRYQVEASAPMRTLLAAVHDGEPVRDALGGLFGALVEQAVHDPDRKGCMMVNAITERATCDPDVARRGRQAIDGMADAFAGVLRIGVDRGEFGDDVDIPAVAAFLVLSVHGIRVQGVVDPDRSRLNAAVEVALSAVH
jgi:TetR/AcrR family transcriptional repressor of nem operon